MARSYLSRILYVTVVSKRGLRAGPVPLAPPAGLAPIPGTVASDADNAFGSEPELFGYLRERRATDDVELTGELVLPASIPRQDVVGFEISLPLPAPRLPLSAADRA